MSEIETDWYNAESIGEHYDAFRTGSALSRHRLFLEEMSHNAGLTVQVPLGTKESLKAIIDYFALVHDGFLLSIKSDHVSRQRKIIDKMQLYSVNESADMQAIQEVIMDLGMGWTDDDPDYYSGRAALIAYLQAVSILNKLNERGCVRFRDFSRVPGNLKLGRSEYVPSYWRVPMTADGIRGALTDLQKNTSMLLFENSVDVREAISAAHFFTTGYLLYPNGRTLSGSDR